jgi:AraC-like DNA-binding protein
MHAEPTDAREYARVFQARVRYNAEHNALVFKREILDAPIQHANVDLWPAFEQQLQSDLTKLAELDGLKARVKQLLAERIGQSSVGLADTARALHMSESTLRRRLAEEGTTYSDLLEELRRELALRHVHDRRLAVGEIAFLLGFATQSAFGKAFRRWSGSSPLEYRAQIRRNAAEAGTAVR